MKATEANLLAFLRKSPQFMIPIYQRTYSWTEAQCRQLWEDILRAGSHEDISAHFIGSVVYIEKGLYQVSSQPLLVIDEQQRLTTVSLIIEALARRLRDTEPIDGFFRQEAAPLLPAEFIGGRQTTLQAAANADRRTNLTGDCRTKGDPRPALPASGRELRIL